ncbi:MAG: RHS repeat-associated core domain-containing protein, partial [Balneolaceae bacterium]
TELTKETFTGKELDEETGMYYFGARYYDAALGRWSVTDPAGQFHSPYAYANNPVSYVDPNGEFAFLVPILVAAAIGAGTSAAVYSTTAGVTGNWNLKDFGKATAFGAVSGAISGGIGSAFAGSALGQTASFGVLSNSASTTLSNVVFGNNITAGTLVGSVVGGVIGGQLPKFSGAEGGILANVSSEIAHSSIKGALTGSVSGGLAAAVDGRNVLSGFAQGAYQGAVGGIGISTASILAFGASYRPEIVEDYDFGKNRPIYRRGTFLTKAFFRGGGITLGRTLVTNRFTEKDIQKAIANNPYANPDGVRNAYIQANEELILHETVHHYQIRGLGLGRFYSQSVGSYLKHGFRASYNKPMTLEWRADYFSKFLYGLR